MNVKFLLPPRRIARSLVTFLLLGFTQIIAAPLPAANATGTPAVSLPTNGWVVQANTNNVISGGQVSGLGTSDTYLVTVSTSGTLNSAYLRLNTTNGLVASYGYITGSNTFSNFTKITFTGTGANINTALSDLRYVASAAPSSGTTPTISISVVENIANLAYNPANGHYYRAYKYADMTVGAGQQIADKDGDTLLSWASDASRYYAGQQGYLVTITTAAEDSFVASTIPNASNIWIGAKDNWSGSQGGTTYSFAEGYWGWASTGSPEFGGGFWRNGGNTVTIDGNNRSVSSTNSLTNSYSPTLDSTNSITTTGAGGASTNGYSNWCTGEPNNAYGSSGEHNVVTNWNGNPCWNDLTSSNSSGVLGFVVEWGDNSASGGFNSSVASASAKVYVAPALTINAGNSQSALVGTTLATNPSIILKDSVGTAIPGVTISWTSLRGTVDSLTPTTNASGIATPGNWRMASTTGPDTLTATYSAASGSPIYFNARANPPTSGDTDTALTLNSASTQYAWDTSTSTLSIANAITMEAWVKPTSINAGSWNMVINKENSYQLGILSYNGVGYWSYGLRGSGNWTGESSTAQVVLNEWHHVAVTRATNSTQVKLYYDGQLAYTGTSDNAGSGALNNASTPFTVGGRSLTGAVGSFSGLFTGQIDHVMVFNTDRTAAQIASDMKTYDVGSTSGLVVYYDFNESSGSTIYNRSTTCGADGDLTLANSASLATAYEVDTTSMSAYTVVKFGHKYLSVAGGWKAPASVTKVAALIVGGGGGGGASRNDGNGGAGGAGGVYDYGQFTVSSSTAIIIDVGVGGHGGKDDTQSTSYGAAGGTTTVGDNFTAGGGGSGGAGSTSPNKNGLTGTASGSGGGASYYNDSSNGGSAGSTGVGSFGGVSLLGRTGYAGSAAASGTTKSGSGGGAGGAATTTSPGPGKTLTFTGTSVEYARGGSGTNATGFTYQQNASTPGSGGSGSSYGVGGNGASGIVIFRWISITKPVYSGPNYETTTAGLNGSLSVTNNPSVEMTRTFKWQYSNTLGNSWVNVGFGSGYLTETFTKTTLSTSDSGTSNLYRVVVTDTDTYGISIIDTSSAVYFYVNPYNQISGSVTSQKYGTRHTDTFTAVVGTGTGNRQFQVTPLYGTNTPNIYWDTSTVNVASVTVLESATVFGGPYSWRLTAQDSKGATSYVDISVVVAKADTLTITVNPISYTYGNSVPTIVETVTGLVNGDYLNYAIPNVWSGTANDGTIILDANQPLNAGTYTYKVDKARASITNSTSYIAIDPIPSSYVINRASRTVSLNQPTSPLKYGDTRTAVVTSSPSTNSDGSVALQSSNLESCTVSALVIQAIQSSGTCQITATLSRGNNYETATASNATKSVTLAQADTITITAETLTAVNYTGSQITRLPSVSVSGLKLSDTGTTQVKYASTTSTLTCADGGFCQVGDTGPGGGKVFYDAGSNQSWGRYLEAAPANWTGSGDSATVNITAWCTLGGTYSSASYSQLTSGIGQGLENTLFMDTSKCTGGAFSRARDYDNGLASDWYLPSQAELELMATASNRALLGLLDVSGKWGYWSSTQNGTTTMKSLVTSTWTIGATNKDDTTHNYTRPIRAFAPAIESTTPPTNAATYLLTPSISMTNGALSNYVNAVYNSSTFTINKVPQIGKLRINQYGAFKNLPFTLLVEGGAGTGSLLETFTAATSCYFSAHILYSNGNSSCPVMLVKSGDQNFLTETLTATIYFFDFSVDVPRNQSGGGSTIAINGATPMETVTATLSIISVGSSGDSTYKVAITGTGFTVGAESTTLVKFWQDVEVPQADIVIKSSSLIWSKQPADAENGFVIVENLANRTSARSPSQFTLLP